MLCFGFCSILSKQTPSVLAFGKFADTIRIRLAVQATSKRLQGHILCWYSNVQNVNVLIKCALRPLRPLRYWAVHDVHGPSKAMVGNDAESRVQQCANHGMCLTESAE